jgi:C1A family cysteine protease
MPSTNRFKVRASLSDWRDFRYKSTKLPLKESVDFRPWSSKVEDQLHLGSCTGQAVVGAYELILKKQLPENFKELSRLFVYYNARLIEGNVEEDQGAYVKDAVKAVYKYGVCSEELWPYDIDLFALPPSIASYEDAAHRTIKNYYKVEGLTNILDAVNSGYPVIASMQVYSNFDEVETTPNFILPHPTKNDDVVGGHAIVVVGYDLLKKLILCRNSFGDKWGLAGHFWIPFDYVVANFSDNWIFDIDIKGEMQNKKSTFVMY